MLRTVAATLSALVLLAALPNPGRADTDQEAGAFLIQLKDQAIRQLTDESVSEESRQERFRALFKANFDIPAIGRFVLGRYWRRAKPGVRADFLATFEDLMVQRFSPIFAGYSDTRFQVDSVRQLKDQDQFLISSTIVPTENEVVTVDWRVRHKDGQFWVLDVIGEGVSMALTLRSEYASVIKTSGGQIDGLVTQLRERVEAGPSSQTSSKASD